MHPRSIPYPYRKAWDDEAQRQLDEPSEAVEFERMTQVEPTERELAFRHAQPFRNNDHKDIRS